MVCQRAAFGASKLDEIRLIETNWQLGLIVYLFIEKQPSMATSDICLITTISVK